ncbi:MAG: recombinase family protein [Lachnospiraceae bacterium]|nr:recombinase family protein [Lachnospiraceae bacterium]
MKIYGYVRVSTLEQNKERQIKNIQSEYPKAVIMTEEYTGKTMDRPIWSKLYSKLKKGDLIVFDEVSRMSRNAEEGFKTYQELFEKGVNLVFLKEPYLNTDVFSGQIRRATVKTGKDYLDQGLKIILMGVAEEQIKIAFEQSQAETDLRAQRAGEGIAEAKKHNEELEVLYPDTYKDHPEYSRIGREKGDKLNIKKAEPIKALIRKYSRDFDGTLSDVELLGVLSTKTVKIPNKKRSGKVEDREISAKLSRNTLYKYKKEMRSE